MAKKYKNDVSEIIGLFDKKTQEVVNDFLTYYKELSHTQYISAIYNMLYVIEKNNIRDLTYKDYENVIIYYNTNERKETTQDKYRHSFFKYLYAFDILNDTKGFEQKWLKSDCEKHFRALKIKKVDKKYKPALTFEELENLHEYINMECQDNKEKMKTSFICYMLYYTECEVYELRDITTNNYIDGKIISNKNNNYEVPKKYEDLFIMHLNDTNYKGFQTINDIVGKLGNVLGIKNLTPQTLKSARKQNSITCSLCGKSYIGDLNNWASVNNKLVCVKCAEALKKNTNYNVGKIENSDIETDKIENNIAISSIIYTFDELKNKYLSKDIDYLKLHEFQMEIGKLGEAYIYDIERKKLSGTKYLELVDNTPAKDGSNGFDILSYDEDGTELYIEVKTEAGLKNNDFYLSQNEIDTGKSLVEQGKKYLIYRVHNILAKDKESIVVEIIHDIFDNDGYNFDSCLWKVSKVNN